MKAKCPHCNGTGEVDVSVAEGDLYTLECMECGHYNGGRISGPGLPPIPAVPDIGCVKCGAAKELCRYKLLSESA